MNQNRKSPLRNTPSPDPRMTPATEGTPSANATKIQEYSEKIMRLYIEGPVNKYYIQTLCMIFFPGSKFSDDEPITEDTPEMWVSMNKSPETGVDVTAKLSYRGQSADAARHYDYREGYTHERLEKIAIGGGISSDPMFIQFVKEEIREFADHIVPGAPIPEVTVCKYGSSANLIGAFYSHRDRFFGNF